MLIEQDLLEKQAGFRRVPKQLGVALALMDEALGWSLYFHGAGGMTARFEARFRQQIAIGSTLVIRAWTLERRARMVKARAEIRLDSDQAPLMVEADASMFLT